MKMTPPHLVTADHWQARVMAREIALALAGLPLDDQQRKLNLIEWIDMVAPMIARARPDISPEQREQILYSIAARALLILQSMDAACGGISSSIN